MSRERSGIPTAEVLPQTDDTTAVEIESDTQSKTGKPATCWMAMW